LPSSINVLEDEPGEEVDPHNHDVAGLFAHGWLLDDGCDLAVLELEYAEPPGLVHLPAHQDHVATGLLGLVDDLSQQTRLEDVIAVEHEESVFQKMFRCLEGVGHA
jgi:hypothetical protein